MKTLVILVCAILFLCGHAFCRDLARGRPTAQSSNYGGRWSRYALDRNRFSCSHTHLNLWPWWRVELHTVAEITRVVISNRADRYGNRLRSFRIVVGNNLNVNSRENRVCATGLNMNPRQTKTFYCRGRPAGQYVFVQIMRREYLELCDVKIFSDPFNYALKKPAAQSSTMFGGQASRAVDGSRNQHFNGRSCTHTNIQYMAWWEVNLQRQVTVTSVEITNRRGSWARLRGFLILVGTKVCNYVINFGRGIRKIKCRQPVVGSFVRIQLYRRRDYLHICEVKVFSELVNVALRKPTLQANVAHHGRSERAVDGYRNSQWHFLSCTHTHLTHYPWWRVDLQQSVPVTHVMITNRGDCCGGWLRPFSIRVGNSPHYGHGRDCRRNNRIPQGKTRTIECSRVVQGRYLVIRIDRRAYLMMCEVEVYSLVGTNMAPRVSSAGIAKQLEREKQIRFARRWAPLVYLPRGERFYPSSVNFFLRHVKMVNAAGHAIRQPRILTERNLPAGGRGYRLTTKQGLCASCTHLHFFRGQRNLRHATVYTFIRKTNRHTLDLFYYFFYPFNLGKRACIGAYFRNFCAPFCYWFKRCICKRFSGCAGHSAYFGNHVGDWEHVSVRLVHGRPRQMYLSAHSFGGLYNWNNRRRTFISVKNSRDYVRLWHGRPVVYSAYGSHGSWTSPGRHVYKRICNGDQLADVVNNGPAWHTWHNLHIIFFKKNRFQYTGREKFLHFDGDWGNAEAGCKYKKITTVCERSSGPSSLNNRATLQTPNPLSDASEKEDTKDMLKEDIEITSEEELRALPQKDSKGKASDSKVKSKEDEFGLSDEDEDQGLSKRFIRFGRRRVIRFGRRRVFRFLRRRIIPKPRIPKIPFSRVLSYVKKKAKELLKKVCPSK